MQETLPVWRRKPNAKYISHLISIYEWWSKYRKGDFIEFYTYSEEANRHFFWLLSLMKDYGQFAQALTEELSEGQQPWENFAEENG